MSLPKNFLPIQSFLINIDMITHLEIKKGHEPIKLDELQERCSEDLKKLIINHQITEKFIVADKLPNDIYNDKLNTIINDKINLLKLNLDSCTLNELDSILSTILPNHYEYAESGFFDIEVIINYFNKSKPTSIRIYSVTQLLEFLDKFHHIKITEDSQQYLELSDAINLNPIDLNYYNEVLDTQFIDDEDFLNEVCSSYYGDTGFIFFKITCIDTENKRIYIKPNSKNLLDVNDVCITYDEQSFTVYRNTSGKVNFEVNKKVK
ncbi:MAG: hypothetical protein [Bacteriophage sp.]|nr:MAG: hypothetical protein [Bacteriophage sp.]